VCHNIMMNLVIRPSSSPNALLFSRIFKLEVRDKSFDVVLHPNFTIFDPSHSTSRKLVYLKGRMFHDGRKLFVVQPTLAFARF
jgi:hypothetical protein